MWTCNDVYDNSNRDLFQRINSSETMVSFLKKVSKEHRYLFHYTTYYALQRIFEAKKWRFTSARRTNDLHECDSKRNFDELKYVFSCSFSHGDEDAIGMWKMYGSRKAAVCVKFETSAIISWVMKLDRIRECYFTNTNLGVDNPFTKNTFRDISMHDIAYVHGSQQKKCSNVCWGNIVNKVEWSDNISKEYLLSGFLKNSAWEYEKETRIMISLPEPSYDKSEETPDEIYLDCEEMLNGIEEIRFSPFSKETKETLNNESRLLREKLNNGNVIFSESYFKGKINT